MTTLTMRLVKGHFIVSGPGRRADEVQVPAGRPATGAPSTIQVHPSKRSGPAASERHARTGALTRPAAEPAQAFFLALGLPTKSR